MTIQMAGVAGGKEHTIECLFRNHRSFMPANLALLMREVALALVISYPFSVDLIHFLPTPGLMEMKICHSSDNIEHCFYIILPGLFWIDTLLFNPQRLIHGHGVI